MRILTVFICFLLFSSSNAQFNLDLEPKPIPQKYLYSNFTTEHGLPSNETFCIYQDSRGYIWIGTDRGLVKYDGYKFKTYTTLDGLIDNVILAITEDSKGNIWYTGLDNARVGYIDLDMNFHRYKYQEKILEYIKENESRLKHFNEIYFDRGNLVLSNNKHGHLVLDNKGGQVKSYLKIEEDNKTEIIAYQDFKCIYTLRGSNNYIVNETEGSQFGNNIYDNSLLLGYYTRDQIYETYPSIVYNDSIQVIYDGYECIEIINNKIKVTNFPSLIYGIQLAPDLTLYSVNQSHDEQSKIYLSNSIDVNKPKAKILEGPRIVNAILDQNKGLWLTSLRHGIFYFPSLNSTVTDNIDPIETMIPFKEGIIYGTVNRGYYLDKKTHEIHKLNQPLNLSILHESIYNINLSNLFETTDGWRNVRYKGYHKLKNDSILYILNGRRFYKRQLINKTTDCFEVLFNISEIKDIYCFKEDSCLLASLDGMYMLDTLDVTKLDYIPEKRIEDIEFLEDKNMLLYTILGEGLSVYYKDTTIALTEKDGLFSNTINQLYIDKNKTVWIATNKGINTLQIEGDEFQLNQVLGASKIIKSPNVLQLYVEDSTMYIGTDKGINIFDLKSEEGSRQQEFPIEITSVSVNNISLNNEALKYLEHDENNLTFSFIGIRPGKLLNIHYKYRLKGLSEEWIHTTERKATFLKVEPGKYTFELEVEDEFGNWMRLKNPIELHIDQPIWLKWWFIIGSVVIILFLIGSILYYYISNLKKEKAFLENEQLLSEELNESQQKALSSQLNPHFVFNSLNSIQNFILTKRTELSSDYLSMFSKLMRFVFENSKKLYVSLPDEIEALRLYLNLEEVRHNNKFKYTIDTSKMIGLDVYIPSLLVQPIIENAIWHGLLHKKENDRLLEVKFYSEGQFLFIEVWDNGVGRNGSKPRPKFIQKQKSSGVELTKQRLNLLSQSTGLETNFKIIDLFDDHKLPCGTCVRISIPLHLENNNK